MFKLYPRMFSISHIAVAENNLSLDTITTLRKMSKIVATIVAQTLLNYGKILY